MRIAIVGAGGIAQKAYFPLLVQRPDLQIVCLYSRTQTTLEKAAQDWGITTGSTNLQDVITCKPQAVFVLSSNDSHYSICKMMLENDLDVYVEKPITLSSVQGFELAQLADERQRILMVAFNRRYALLYQQAKQILSDRKIQVAVFQKHRPQLYHANLYNQYTDDTIHQIDLMRYYCGNLQVLSTSYEMQDNKLANAVSTASMDTGGLAVLINSLQAGAWQESVSLHAEGISVHVSAFRDLRVVYSDHEEIFGNDRPGKWIPDLRERGFNGEIEHFFECLKTRQMPLTNAWEAAKTQELVEKLVLASGDRID